MPPCVKWLTALVLTLGACAPSADGDPAHREFAGSGSVLNGSDYRWTSPLVYYWIYNYGSGSNPLPADRDTINTSIAGIRGIPFQFSHWTDDINPPPGDYITFMRDTSLSDGSGGTDRYPGSQLLAVIRLGDNTYSGTVRHELGHALGLLHEHIRPDRNSHVDLFCHNAKNGCGPDGVTPAEYAGFDNYGIVTSSTTFTPYDFDSLMHYDSWTQAIHDDGDCNHAVMKKKNGNCFSGGSGDYSPEDRNALYQMYEPQLGTNGSGDEFGAAMASGDFDGDGYDDLAVGAPGKSSNAVACGAVFVYKGTSNNGLVPWRVLWGQSFEGAWCYDGDRFGAALATRNVDGNTGDELFIGAPGYLGYGAVFYAFGDATEGPKAGGMVTQGSLGYDTNQYGDGFGTAVAPLPHGYYYGDSSYLAVGAPYKVVGGVRTGKVSVLRWQGGSSPLQLWNTVPGAAANDRFGWSLNGSHDFNGDGISDLVVGAPQQALFTPKPGAVYVFSGVNGYWNLPNFTKITTSPANGDLFGYAVAGGNLDGTGGPELVVGAPYKLSSGRVYTFRNSGSGLSFSLIEALDETKLQYQTNDVGDFFGAAVKVRDLNGDTYSDIVVGVPRKSGNGYTDQGRVDVFHSQGTSGLMNGESVLYSSVSGSELGTALAGGDFDAQGTGQMAIGAPFRDDHGQFEEYSSPTGPLGIRRYFTEETYQWR